MLVGRVLNAIRKISKCKSGEFYYASREGSNCQSKDF